MRYKSIEKRREEKRKVRLMNKYIIEIIIISDERDVVCCMFSYFIEIVSVLYHL